MENTRGALLAGARAARLALAALLAACALALAAALPQSAWAEDEPANTGEGTAESTANTVSTLEQLSSAISNAEDNVETTITLGASIEGGELQGSANEVKALVTIPRGKSIVLDLNGYTISASLKTDGSSYGKTHVLLNNGTLTIKDSGSSGQAGAISNTNTNSHGCTRTVKNDEGATLNITGGTITSAGAVGLLNLGTCTISGNTTIQSLKEGYTGGWDNACAAIENRSNGNLTIKGGTFSSKSEAALFTDGGSTTIEGGSFTGSTAYGAVNGEPSSYVVAKGGTFSSDPSAFYHVEGCYVVENNGVYEVKSASASTDLTISTSSELASALANATASEPKNLTVSGNVTLDDVATLPGTWTLTVAEGSTLTVSEGAGLNLTGQLVNNGNLAVQGLISPASRITNNGTIDVPAVVDGVYVASDAMDLQWLAVLLAADGQSGINAIELANDITCPQGVAFECLGDAEEVVFDGHNYAINDLSMNVSGGCFGLFEYLENSTVKNLVMKNCNLVTDTGYLGAVVGQSNGSTFDNVDVSGSVVATGASYGVAGIAGSVYNTESTAETLFVDCSVSDATIGGPSAYNVGSMFGTASGSMGKIGVYNCANSGAITAAGSVGYVYGFGYLNSAAQLEIIGFNSQGGTVNGEAGTISSAAGTGYTSNIDNAGSQYVAGKTAEGTWRAYNETEAAVLVTNESGVSSPYATLQAAVEAAKPGDIVKVMRSITVPSDSEIVVPSGVVLRVTRGATLTNEGTIDVYGTVENLGGIVDNNDSNPIQYHVNSLAIVGGEEALAMTVGDTKALEVEMQPANAVDALTWKSSDESVATVDAEGKVKAIAPGSAVITVTSANGKSAECKVTVIAKEDPKPTPDPNEPEPGPTPTPDPDDDGNGDNPAGGNTDDNGDGGSADGNGGAGDTNTNDTAADKPAKPAALAKTGDAVPATALAAAGVAAAAIACGFAAFRKGRKSE
ncbi:MAG: Ig-like domain-containing protein [Eggerthellaceae bacterium]|nr:Ig-like domain-containing protein [Eggerthellaceae bacterium]